MSSKPWRPAVGGGEVTQILYWSPEVGYRIGNSAESGGSRLPAALLLAARAVQAGMPFSIWAKDDGAPLIDWDGSRESRPAYHRPELEPALVEMVQVYGMLQNMLLERVRADLMLEIATQRSEAAARPPETPSTGSETPPPGSESEAPTDSDSAEVVQDTSAQSLDDNAPTVISTR
jgi:hypothetical protein